LTAPVTSAEERRVVGAEVFNDTFLSIKGATGLNFDFAIKPTLRRDMAPSWVRNVQKGLKPPLNRPKSLKRKRDEEDLGALCKRVAELDAKLTPPSATFTDLPLSKPTQSGLKESQFLKLTAIQASAIPLALKGTDILGAAKTGSGKTLTFLVPVLENLYRKRWSDYDGLGALILSPTRELAIQIFEVLRKVGRYHAFSAGLVIGGKSLQEERDRLGRMNILVATPGRMLQHMDQTAEFEIGNLQMLVLDEADRIMDMGFRETVDAIVDHLPKERQTLLFSATQTKRVSDLARLSLSEPEFVSVHEGADSATPATLQQNYVVTPLPDKLDTLWSFMRANLKKKILVFLSSGKQVRFVYEAFRHLQPGLPLLHLHGRQKQTARLDITTRFSATSSACLFATDVAARGLDFPAVDWVVQVDCPEDADTYIHRVGRTARYERDGQAVMFVDPSEEEGMLAALERKKVIPEKISVRGSKMQSTIRNQLQNMCFKDPELKYLGQKAFVSYVRSVHIQKDKNVFQLQNLDLEHFAASMGLPGAPRVKFVKGEDAKHRKNAPRQLLAALNDSEGEGGGKQEKLETKTKYDRMFQRRNQDVLAEHYAKMIDTEDGGVNDGDPATADADEDNDFLAVRRRFDAGDAALGASDPSSSDVEADQNGGEDRRSQNEIKGVVGGAQSEKTDMPCNAPKKAIRLSNHPDEVLLVDSKRREKLLKSKKKLLKFKGQGAHLHFDDDDVPYEAEHYQREEEFAKSGRADEQREAFVMAEKQKTEVADLEDKELAKRKRREKREKRKAREREREHEEHDGGKMAILVPYEGDGLEDEGGMEVGEKPPKRQKKWFESASSGEEGPGGDKKRKKQNMRGEHATGPQTVEDLEAIAQGILDK
jgi:ATP-dependent RNA helicase DDX10/DBP4